MMLKWWNFFLQDENDWMNSHASTFSGIDPSYALPNNIAVITLQVFQGIHPERISDIGCPY